MVYSNEFWPWTEMRYIGKFVVSEFCYMRGLLYSASWTELPVLVMSDRREVWDVYVCYIFHLKNLGETVRGEDEIHVSPHN